MADQQVNMIVNVVTKGSEKLKEVNQELAKTAKTQTEGTAISAKANDALTKTNTNLSKQIPVLRELNPIMRQVGLGWLAGASAIAAVSAGAILCNQAFGTWLTSMTGLAVTLNTTTGQTWSFNDAVSQVTQMAADNKMPMKELADAYSALLVPTHDSAIALDILQTAITIHKQTGLPLADIVRDLAGAYSGMVVVYDDMKNAVPPGVEAVKLLEEQMLAAGSSVAALKTSIDDTWSSDWETVKTGLGLLTEVIKVGLIAALLPVTNFTEAVKVLLGGGGWVDALGHLLGLGGWEGVEPLPPGAEGGPTDTVTPYLPPGEGTEFPEGAADRGTWIEKLPTLAEWLEQLIKEFSVAPGAAVGADVTMGGRLWVGERGPELLNLPTGAQVSPLDQGGSASPKILQVFIGNELLSQFVIDDLNTAVRLRGGH